MKCEYAVGFANVDWEWLGREGRGSWNFCTRAKVLTWRWGVHLELWPRGGCAASFALLQLFNFILEFLKLYRVVQLVRFGCYQQRYGMGQKDLWCFSTVQLLSTVNTCKAPHLYQAAMPELSCIIISMHNKHIPPFPPYFWCLSCGPSSVFYP